MAEDKKQIKNIVKIEDSGPCKKKISIEIPEEKIKEVVVSQYSDLRKEAVLPGFRKGRAPMRLLEKRFSGDVSDQAKLKLLAEATEEVLQEKGLNTLGDPNIDHENIELPESGAMKFDFEVEVRPEIKLPELEGIEVEKTAFEVNDEQVDSEVAEMQKRLGIWAPREDGSVEMDDQLIADIVVKAEGDEETEKIDNTEVFVSEKSFVGKVPVDTFAEAVKGKKVGDKLTVETDVPETFFNEKYRGKKVSVSVEIKEIKCLQPAEMNEEFFAKLGLTDEAELRERISEMAQQRSEQETKTAMADNIYKHLLENTNFDLPQAVVADQATQILQRQYTRLLMQGGEAEKVEEQMEELRASSETQAAEQLKIFFIMDEIADKLEISVSEEEINGYIAQVAMQRNRRPEKMREELLRNGSLAQFSMQAREQKCIDQLLEKANIKEVAAGSTAKKATKKKATKKATAKKATTKKTTKKKTTKKKESDA